MSAQDGGPAFPILERGANGLELTCLGMSLRDYFAAKAIAIVARQADLDNAGTSEMAGACYEFADELLTERERPLVERMNDRMAADNANERATRYERLLRSVVDACTKGNVIPTDALQEALIDAAAQLADDEVPF